MPTKRKGLRTVVATLAGMDLQDISSMILLTDGVYDFAVKSLKTPPVPSPALVGELREGPGSLGHVHLVVEEQGRHYGK